MEPQEPLGLREREEAAELAELRERDAAVQAYLRKRGLPVEPGSPLYSMLLRNGPPAAPAPELPVPAE